MSPGPGIGKTPGDKREQPGGAKDELRGFILRCRRSYGERQRRRSTRLLVSDIITVIIDFHQFHYRHFKGYYLGYVRGHLKEAFPERVSYQRFVALIPSVLVPLCAYLQQRKGQATGVAFINATSIAVCHNRRINRHQVFKKIAQRGKTSMGWFYGFKLRAARFPRDSRQCR